MASTHPAASDASSAALIPLGTLSSAAPIELKRPVFVIGARKDIVGLHLQSSTVSNAHCVVVLNGWGCYVHDLGSRTGTLVNGKPVTDTDLADGDVVHIGRFQFRYRAPKRVRPKPLPLPPGDLTVATLPVPLAVNKRVLVVGRRLGSDVQFDDSQVSNVHAIIVEQDGRRLVRDLKSRTGTWLDDKPVHQEPLPDGEPLRVGKATITITPRGVAAVPGRPITLADAAPSAAIGLDAPAADDLDFADELGLDLPSAATPSATDLDAIDLDAPALEPDPSDTVPAGDDLAALRRGWKAPPRPVDEIEADAKPARSPAPGRSRPTPPAAPLNPAPLPPLIPLVVDDAAHTPPAPPANIPLAVPPTPETPTLDLADPRLDESVADEADEADEAADEAADAAVVDVPTLELPFVAEPIVSAAAPLDLADLDLERAVAAPAVVEPAVVEPAVVEPAAEVFAPVEPAVPDPEAEVVAPADDAAIDIDALVLDDAASAEAELPTRDAALVEPVAGVEAVAAEVVAERPTEDVAEAAAPLVIPEPPAIAAESDEVEAALADPEAADAGPAEVDALRPDPAAPEITPPGAAVMDVDALDLDDIAGPAVSTVSDDDVLELLNEPAANATPAADVTLPVEVAAESRVDAAKITPAGLSETEAVADAGVIELPTTLPDEVEVVADDIGPPEPLDLSVGLLPPEAEVASVAEAAASAEIDEISPKNEVGHEVSDMSVPVSDTAEATADEAETPWVSATSAGAVAEADAGPAAGDLVDLRADLEEVERDEDGAGIDAAALGATQIDHSDLTPPTAAEAAAETVAERRDGTDAGHRFTGGVLDDAAANDAATDDAAADEPPSQKTLSDYVIGHDPAAKSDSGPAAVTPVLPDLTEPVTPATTHAFIAPDEPPAAPAIDLVRLSEDFEDENEATALAVDLGLVLDDDLGQDLPVPTGPVAGPAGPVDIDLADATPARVEASDLAEDGVLGEATFQPYMPAAATPAGHGPADDALGDVFDADAVEVIDDTRPPTPVQPPVRPAAEHSADAGDNDIAAPGGGSLADLMPSGPPLLGGSFMSLPPMLPPEPQAGGGRRRPLRVGFGQEPQRPSRNAPFAADRTIAHAMGDSDVDAIDDGLDAGPGNGLGKGLGNGTGTHRPTGPLVDAFSSAPITAATDDATAEAIPAETLLGRAERFRPRGVIRPVVPAVAADEPASVYVPHGATAVSSASASVDVTRVRKHKRRVRRVIACVVAMVILAGGAAWGVYYYTPLKSTVDALISYDGLDRLGTGEANDFRIRQNAALLSETVRVGAITSLPPSVPAGFLADSKKLFDTVVSDPKVRWPAEQATVMRLRVRSTDKENDVARLRALAGEIVKTGDADRATIEKTRDLIREDSTEISEKRRQLSDLNDQLQALQQKAVNKSDLKNLSDLNAEYLAAEPALTAIKSKRQELEATIETLQRVPVAATAPAADPASVDEELAKLTKQLADLQQAAKPAADNGLAARKELDATIARFDEDLAKAQKLRDNPQLAAYLDAVKRMFTQTRQMTEGLIRRQEIQQTRLSELKAALYEKMQARTEDLLGQDAELKKLRDEQALLTRKYNAAIGDGSMADAEKLKALVRLADAKIGEREDRFRNDPVYGPMIAGLQRVIDAGEAETRTDRKTSNDSLTALQQEFMKSAPAVEKMPAEQKALAEGIEQRLAAMNEARRAYAAAAEAAQAAQVKAEADSREKAAALRLQIASRRQDVIAAAKAREAQDDAAARQAKLAAVQKELIDVRAQEQAAQHRLADAGAAIETAERARRALALAESDRQAKLLSRDAVQRSLQSANASVSLRQSQLAKLIVPSPNIEWHDYPDEDRRPMLAAAIAGGIVLLLLIPIIFDLLALAREGHMPEPTTPDAEAAEGFEPLLTRDPPRPALPEPASV